MSKWLPLVIAFLLAWILLWILCSQYPDWFVCPGCPESNGETDCDECLTDAPVLIQTMDIHTAAWIPFDNEMLLDIDHATGAVTLSADVGTTNVCTETSPTDEQSFGQCGGTYASSFIPGIMMQLGDDDEDGFDGVDIWIAGETAARPYDPGTFDWIDVTPASGSCVIDALHANTLFSNLYTDADGNVREVVEMVCDDAVDIVTAEMVPDDTPADTSDDVPYPSTCTRNRQIHANLETENGLITIWAGVGDLKIESDRGAGLDVGYNFRLCEEVVVDIWNNGCFLERLTNVELIQVKYDPPVSDHTVFHDPPTDGGDITDPAPIVTPPGP